MLFSPTPGAASQEIVLPGNTQAFNDTPIYARTNGYLKRWYVDIGAHVSRVNCSRRSTLPEIDQQLEQARADLKNAQATSNWHRSPRHAGRTCSKRTRLQAGDRSGGQDLSARQASVDSMTANVHRLEQLQSFEKVYAPFSGVITARNTDIGALINAGCGRRAAGALPHGGGESAARLRRCAGGRLSGCADRSQSALTLDEFPGENISGHDRSQLRFHRSRLAHAECRSRCRQRRTASRPGLMSLCISSFPSLPKSPRNHSPSQPTPCSFGLRGLRVGVVRNGRAELVPIKIGRDFGSTVEVVAGLQPTDQVIVNPSDSLTSGSPVQVSAPQAGGSNETQLSGIASVCSLSLLLSGCMVGPKYVKPTVPMAPAFKEQPPESFKEVDGWKPAQPGDQTLRGKWWEIFGDSQLNALEEELTVSNQDLKVSEARFRQARAMIRFNRSARVSDDLYFAEHRQ
jgi:hypothetical protein